MSRAIKVPILGLLYGTCMLLNKWKMDNPIKINYNVEKCKQGRLIYMSQR